VSKDSTIYAPVHLGIFTSIKLRRFARGLGIADVHAVGHLAALWTRAANSHPDGALLGWGDEDIADQAMWEGDAAVFARSLVAAGFAHRAGDGAACECLRGTAAAPAGTVLLHEWSTYTGWGISRRAAERARKRRGTSAELPATFRGASAELPRNIHGTSAEAARISAEPPRISAATGSGSGSGQDREREREKTPPTPPGLPRAPQSRQTAAGAAGGGDSGLRPSEETPEPPAASSAAPVSWESMRPAQRQQLVAEVAQASGVALSIADVELAVREALAWQGGRGARTYAKDLVGWLSASVRRWELRQRSTAQPDEQIPPDEAERRRAAWIARTAPSLLPQPEIDTEATREAAQAMFSALRARGLVASTQSTEEPKAPDPVASKAKRHA
jgi:hypothetical protein